MSLPQAIRSSTRSRISYRRQFSSTCRRWQDAQATTPPVTSQVAPPPPPPPPPRRRPIGGLRGGLFGFLFGFSLASGFAAYHLLDEYKLASATLQASVDELQSSTRKVSEHVRRIEAVEKDLKALAERSASRDDVSKVRTEMKKLYDGLHIEFLDLRAHVWGMQQDLHSVLNRKKEEEKPHQV